VFVTAPFPFCTNLNDAALFPFVDRRQAAQFDQKRRASSTL
jgi:hypothetical protein